MVVRATSFGPAARLFTLEAGGMRAAVTDVGAALVALHHRDGTNIVLGFDDITGYHADSQFMGVVVGRCANRIGGGRLVLDGQAFALPCNDGANHLHGGPDGFGRRVWQAEADSRGTAVSFSLASPHLDQGYPGEVTATATYRLHADGRLVLTLAATADRPTIVNLVPHGYFNLAGAGDIRDHLLQVHAQAYTPTDAALIPTGEIAAVADTPFDLRQPRPFPPDIDLNFVVDGPPGTLRDVATVDHPASGRRLHVRATASGVQVYGGRNLGQGGRFAAHAGFCLEPQYFPDAPNQTGFAVPRVDSDTPYREVVEYTLT
jgi:aldose 1-epimerase